jgi:hypothetical protein
MTKFVSEAPMKKRWIISTAVFFLVCSCADPNELGWVKIEENSLSIIYLNSLDQLGTGIQPSSEKRDVKLRSDSKDGFSRTEYIGEINCEGETFHYTKTMTTNKNVDGSINTVENSFADNPQPLRLTLAADEALHDAVCGPW